MPGFGVGVAGFDERGFVEKKGLLGFVWFGLVVGRWWGPQFVGA